MKNGREPLFPFAVSSSPIHLDSSHTRDWYRLLLLREGSLRFAASRGQTSFSGECVLLFHPETANIIRTSRSPSYEEIRFSDAFIEEIDIRCWDDRFLASLQTLKDSGDVVRVELNQQALEKIARLFREIDDEYGQAQDGYRTVIRLKFIELMVMIFRGSRSTKVKSETRKAAWSIDDVIRHIQENYTEEFNLQELASRCGLNRSYFSRSFKDAAGTPLFEYINRLRIQKACLLLKRGNLSVSEIAFAVGYNNLSFFYRYFSKIMKLTPREYRTAAQK
jgi:AraC-like DNA-binding protein